MSYAFLENEGGTHIEIRIGKVKPRDMAFLEHVVEEFRTHITDEIAVLREMLECDRSKVEQLEPVVPTKGFAAELGAPARF
jgi:hypothetical protein